MKFTIPINVVAEADSAEQLYQLIANFDHGSQGPFASLLQIIGMLVPDDYEIGSISCKPPYKPTISNELKNFMLEQLADPNDLSGRDIELGNVYDSFEECESPTVVAGLKDECQKLMDKYGCQTKIIDLLK